MENDRLYESSTAGTTPCGPFQVCRTLACSKRLYPACQNAGFVYLVRKRVIQRWNTVSHASLTSLVTLSENSNLQRFCRLHMAASKDPFFDSFWRRSSNFNTNASVCLCRTGISTKSEKKGRQHGRIRTALHGIDSVSQLLQSDHSGLCEKPF
jgi:hypothetical protein